MIKASLRGLLQRKLRLTLAVIAIVLSVAFLAGSMVLSDTLNSRFKGLFATINENVAVVVEPAKKSDADGKPVLLTAAELQVLSTVDGVKTFEGDVSGEGVIPFESDTGKAVTTQAAIAAGVRGEDQLGLVVLREGQMPTTADQVAISANTAKLSKVKLGDKLKVFVPQLGEPSIFTVSGIVGFSGGRDSLAGETLILFELGYAQETFYGKRDVFGSASFSAKDGVSQEELKKQIEAKLPAGFKAKTGKESTEEQSNQIANQFTFFNIILGGFAMIAALVGVFLIYNTFNIIVAQRSRELALLRAMGAGWGQVIGTVLLEALIVGGVGSTLGIAAGAGAGAWGESWLTSGVDFGGLGGIVLSPSTIVWSYAMGVLVTIIAALIPAIKASMVPPVAAMREIARPDKSLKGLSITGGAFLALGATLVTIALAADVSSGTLMLSAGIGLAFVGTALLSPLLSKPVVRGLGLIVGRGQAGRLGLRNSLRNPRRTAVTAIALMIGVTLISLAATVVQSFKTSLSTDIGRFDIAVAVLGPNNAPPDGRTGFNPEAMNKVKALPGITDTASWHIMLDAALGGQPSASGVAATDVAVAQRMWKLETVSGELRTLSAGEFVIDLNSAKDRGWKAGDEIDIRIGTAERRYKLVGIYKSVPAVNGPILSLSAVDDFAGPLAYQGFVSVAQGTDIAATVAAIDKIMADYPGVTVGDMSSLLKQFNQIFDFLLLAITVLLGVALVIALLGILNTLLLSIVERTRELGLVRAVGMNRGGIVRMIGVESVLISVFGCLLGLAMGVGAGVAFSQALVKNAYMTTIVIPWSNLAGYVIMAIVFGVLAAVIPAWQAARLNVLDAIAYE